MDVLVVNFDTATQLAEFRKQHIGKEVLVNLNDGSTCTGKMKDVDPKKITLSDCEVRWADVTEVWRIW